MKKLLPTSCPKPKRAPPKKRSFSSIKRPPYAESLVRAAAVVRKPVKKTNAKRKGAEFKRCYGSVERVEWVKTLPCIVGGTLHPGSVENAHVGIGGAGRKSDARHIVPLCNGHHRALHLWGRQTFERVHNVLLETAAAKTHLLWLEVSAAGGGERT